MGLINPTIPTIGDFNSTEDPDIRSGMNTITNEINGNLDNSNIKTTAQIAHAKLANATAGQLLIANGSGVVTATTTPTSGDATIASDGTITIGNDKVTQAKMADASVGPAELTPGALATTVPTGCILCTAGVAAPTGYVMCDGASLSTTGTYAALFAVIAYGYGGAGANFNVPDLRGRVPVGVDGAANRLTVNDALGNSGGVQFVTLAASELPAHTHQSFSVIQPGVGNIIRHDGLGASGIGNPTTDGGSGGGGSHQNMQPYQIVNYIIKI